MKIYKLTQTDSTGYDTCSGMIVIAENENLARQMHPFAFKKSDVLYDFDRIWINVWGWAKSPENVNVEYLGEAKLSEYCRIVMISFVKG